MAVFEPTQAQKQAINAAGGSITVSAAAGSGKTRVLVERVIQILKDGRSSADRLLILTFTNTAAAEMKTRISDAIEKLICEDPENENYRKQQILLGSADICTIDSFCSRIVKENFYRLGISRDFRIGSIPELYDMQMKLMSAMIDERYDIPAKDSVTEEEYENAVRSAESFSLLGMILTNAKSDSGLEDSLHSLYEKYIAHAFPEDWMNKCISMYDPSVGLNGNNAAEYMFSRKKGDIAAALEEASGILKEALAYKDDLEAEKKARESKKPVKPVTVFNNILGKYDLYSDYLETAIDMIGKDKVDIEAFSDLTDALEQKSISYGSSKDENVISSAKLMNSLIKIINDEVRPNVQFTPEIFRRNNELLYPVMKELGAFLKEFSDRYFVAKCEKNILDFHDLEALMLRLLYDKDADGNIIITPFAAEMSSQYDEIMVDEYQDTNDIQESIFKAISRDDSNLFVVGDVKQSIYRFRDAKPELFNSRCSSSTLYSETEKKFPALIILDQNFRSRKSIIDSVNYVFGLLMSKASGDIEYDSMHRLTASADYPASSNTETELHIIEYKKPVRSGGDDASDTDDEDDDVNKEETEAIYCAALIRKMIDQGYQVKDKKSGCMRRAVPGDFCILLRAVRNRAFLYANELEKLDIPSYTDTEFDLLSRYEVRAAVSYLKIMNNPLSETDMLAALLCPTTGFTPDDLVELKKVPGRCYYKKLLCIYLSGKKEDEKSEGQDAESINKEKREFIESLREKYRPFTELLNDLRTAAITMPVDKLLMYFFEKTGFMSVMRAMPDGENRIINLRRLLHYAESYESSASGGLTGFIRHIRSLEENSGGIKVSDSAMPDAVRIMTIHHSKGLEFPVCILAATNSKGKDDKSNINYHSGFGFGCRIIDDEKLLKFDSLQYAAVKTAVTEEEKSEMLRVLYVAMTRPKEKLIILSTVNCSDDNKDVPKDADDGKTAYNKYLAVLAGKVSYDPSVGRIDASTVRSCKTFSDMIIMCSLLNGSMQELRADAGVVSPDEYSDEEATELPLLDCNTPWKYHHCADAEEFSEVIRRLHRKQELKEEMSEKEDTAFTEFLKSRFAPKKMDLSTKIPTKVSASTLAHSANLYAVALSEPSFAKTDAPSGTERGTSFHKFLQHCDLSALKHEIETTGSFEMEKSRIKNEGLMSEKQISMISDEIIKSFTADKLCERMINARALYPEYQFTVEIPGKLALKDEVDEEALAHSDTECNTILQGAMDCVMEEDDGIVIIDYKSDRVNDAAKLADIYGIQLKLYAEAAKQLFDKPVKGCIIYSLHKGCSVPVAADDNG